MVRRSIGMKSLNGTADAVKKGVIRAADATRYVMSLPVSVVCSGIDSLKLLRENLRIAREFTPMSRDERQWPTSSPIINNVVDQRAVRRSSA